jgi:hypothetical protein
MMRGVSDDCYSSVQNKTFACIPFDSDSDNDETKSDEDQLVLRTIPFSSESETEVNLDACDICYKSFPSADFVKLHKKVFHSRNIVIRLNL